MVEKNIFLTCAYCKLDVTRENVYPLDKGEKMETLILKAQIDNIFIHIIY